ncbi:unnamed protein product [Gordionus sp. m RMFG-2023]
MKSAFLGTLWVHLNKFKQIIFIFTFILINNFVRLNSSKINNDRHAIILPNVKDRIGKNYFSLPINKRNDKFFSIIKRSISRIDTSVNLAKRSNKLYQSGLNKEVIRRYNKLHNVDIGVSSSFPRLSRNIPYSYRTRENNIHDNSLNPPSAYQESKFNYYDRYIKKTHNAPIHKRIMVKYPKNHKSSPNYNYFKRLSSRYFPISDNSSRSVPISDFQKKPLTTSDFFTDGFDGGGGNYINSRVRTRKYTDDQIMRPNPYSFNTQILNSGQKVHQPTNYDRSAYPVLKTHIPIGSGPVIPIDLSPSLINPSWNNFDSDDGNNNDPNRPQLPPRALWPFLNNPKPDIGLNRYTNLNNPNNGGVSIGVSRPHSFKSPNIDPVENIGEFEFENERKSISNHGQYIPPFQKDPYPPIMSMFPSPSGRNHPGRKFSGKSTKAGFKSRYDLSSLWQRPQFKGLLDNILTSSSDSSNKNVFPPISGFNNQRLPNTPQIIPINGKGSPNLLNFLPQLSNVFGKGGGYGSTGTKSGFQYKDLELTLPSKSSFNGKSYPQQTYPVINTGQDYANNRPVSYNAAKQPSIFMFPPANPRNRGKDTKKDSFNPLTIPETHYFNKLFYVPAQQSFARPVGNPPRN